MDCEPIKHLNSSFTSDGTDSGNLVRSLELEKEANEVSRITLRARLQGNPFFVFVLAFISAWAYLITPNCNYWVYNMVKNQWWNILTVTGYVELQDSCLMDASNRTYYCCYFVGFFMPPFLHLIAYLRNLESSYSLNTLAPTTSIIVVLCSYAVDVLRNPLTNVKEAESREDTTISNSIGRGARVTHTFFDTFTASVTEDEAIAAEEGVETNSVQEVSSGRGLWQRVRKERSFAAAVTQLANTAFLQQRQRVSGSHNGAIRSSVTSTSDTLIVNPMFRHASTVSRRGELFNNNVDETHSNALLLRLTYYLPRKVYHRMGIPTGRITIRDRRYVGVFISAFNVLFNLYYYFLMFFTEYFRRQKSSDGNSFKAIYQKSVLFFVFVVIGSLFRVGIKRCGMILDGCKEGTSSMYFIGEVMCLLFYYTFYRVLFESLTSWYEFAFFQFIHLFSEWILYPLRASKLFYDGMQRFESRSISKGCFLPTGIDHSDWLTFIALDFGIRFSIMVSTGVSFLLFFLGIDFIPWVTNSLKQEGAAMALSSEMITVAVLLEIVNAYVMNCIFFKAWNMSITGKVFNCFSDIRFSFIAFLLAAGLYIKPIFAFTDNTFR